MPPKKDYLKLAKANITTPSQAKVRRRFLIYGRNKKGKTRFCLTANDMPKGRILVIDAEHGTDEFKRMNPDVWHVTKWEQMDEVWGALRTGKLPYDWVALDQMTKINNLALRFIMKISEEANLDVRPGIVDRRYYNKSGELMKELVVKFDALPLNVIYTVQERMVTGSGDDDEEEETTMHVPDVPQGVRGALNSIVDVIGRIYVVKAQFKVKKGGEEEIVEKNQRRLWIGNHERYDTGYRSDYDELPEMLKNPTVPRLMKLLDTGKIT